MKLRNKKTGEIVEDAYVRETHDFQFDGQKHVLAVFRGNGHRPPERISGPYNSLAKLNEDWEDYDETKVGYLIDPMEEDCVSADDSGYEESDIERAKELGIWFETEEGAAKAVKKLKALTRLKDKGLKFGDFECDFKSGKGTLCFEIGKFEFNYDDFDLLFPGGEE